jgi:hypothetical protein
MRAAEKHSEFAQKLRIMFCARPHETEEVVKIPWVSAVSHGFDFSCEQLLNGENREGTCSVIL